MASLASRSGVPLRDGSFRRRRARGAFERSSPAAPAELRGDRVQREDGLPTASPAAPAISVRGLSKRVALARALLPDPQVLFLDEPTSGLDPIATREVHGLIDELRGRGVTIFLTTHRLDEAERLCDRVAILSTTLRMIGRPEELRDR